jgi:hypothetical protein
MGKIIGSPPTSVFSKVLEETHCPTLSGKIGFVTQVGMLSTARSSFERPGDNAFGYIVHA